MQHEGKLAAEIAKQYGINPGLIYKWINKRIEPDNTLPELNKLRRENEELLRSIGKLTHEMRRGEKSYHA